MQTEKNNQGQRAEILAWIEEYKAKWHGARDLKYRFENFEGDYSGGIALTNVNDGIVRLNYDYVWQNKEDFESTLIHEHFCHYYFTNYFSEKRMLNIYAMTMCRKDFKIFREKYLIDYPDKINNAETQMRKIFGSTSDKTDTNLKPYVEVSFVREFFAYYVEDHYKEWLTNTTPNFILWIGEKLYGPGKSSKVDSLFIRLLRKYRDG